MKEPNSLFIKKYAKSASLLISTLCLCCTTTLQSCNSDTSSNSSIDKDIADSDSTENNTSDTSDANEFIHSIIESIHNLKDTSDKPSEHEYTSYNTADLDLYDSTDFIEPNIGSELDSSASFPETGSSSELSSSTNFAITSSASFQEIYTEYITSFTHDGCKNVQTDDGANTNTNAPSSNEYGAKIVRNGDSYQFILPDVQAKCDLDPEKVTATIDHYDDHLIFTISDTTPENTNCLPCTYDLKIDIKPDHANSDIGVFENKIFFIEHEGYELKDARPYGLYTGTCKRLATDTSISASDLFKYNFITLEEEEESSAKLLSYGTRYEILITNVSDYCHVEDNPNLSIEGDTLVIKYSSEAIISKCVCISDHWFELDKQTIEQLPNISKVMFKDTTYDIEK